MVFKALFRGPVLGLVHVGQGSKRVRGEAPIDKGWHPEEVESVSDGPGVCDRLGLNVLPTVSAVANVSGVAAKKTSNARCAPLPQPPSFVWWSTRSASHPLTRRFPTPASLNMGRRVDPGRRSVWGCRASGCRVGKRPEESCQKTQAGVGQRQARQDRAGVCHPGESSEAGGRGRR